MIVLKTPLENLSLEEQDQIFKLSRTKEVFVEDINGTLVQVLDLTVEEEDSIMENKPQDSQPQENQVRDTLVKARNELMSLYVTACKAVVEADSAGKERNKKLAYLAFTLRALDKSLEAIYEAIAQLDTAIENLNFVIRSKQDD